ncbi:MAG TPA: zinc ribbon domain-containing protein [Spirochaetota bacterium]|nr:zinc ribbon domain-containing protein [Spirochaetota bacterium]
MFCSKCGQKNEDSAKFCVSCGNSIGSSEKRCDDCGTILKSIENYCSKCGKKYSGSYNDSNLKVSSKSKTTAVMLAIFFSFFSYLYTYRKNYVKFLILFSVLTGFVISSITNSQSEDAAILSLVVGLGLWVFSIIDNAVRSTRFYDYYPASSGTGKSKPAAVTLSFLFGPFGLLYTFSKDWGKLLAIVAGTFVIHGLTGSMGKPSPIFNVIPWLGTVIFSLARSEDFYNDYDKSY